MGHIVTIPPRTSLKSSFALAGPALQPAITILSVAQTMTNLSGEPNGELSPITDNPFLQD